MSTLPRLKPKCFYDLVVEVALIRPGPIQGQAVNPYLARRSGREKSHLPASAAKTRPGTHLGVPLFQEQLMRIAKDAAGFNGSQSDNLRRAMGRKNPGNTWPICAPSFSGHGKESDPAAGTRKNLGANVRLCRIRFPGIPRFSFAYLVYASAWLKAYYPAVFTPRSSLTSRWDFIPRNR